jgi:hypothetical protein
MPTPTPVLSARGRLGFAKRSGNRDAIVTSTRDLAAAKIEQYVENVVATAPPLTADQRDRIAALLGGGA